MNARTVTVLGFLLVHSINCQESGLLDIDSQFDKLNDEMNKQIPLIIPNIKPLKLLDPDKMIVKIGKSLGNTFDSLSKIRLSPMGTRTINNGIPRRSNNQLAKKYHDKSELEMKMKDKPEIRIHSEPKLISLKVKSDSLRPEKRLVVFDFDPTLVTKMEPITPNPKLYHMLDGMDVRIHNSLIKLGKDLESVSNESNFNYQESGKINHSDSSEDIKQVKVHLFQDNGGQHTERNTQNYHARITESTATIFKEHTTESNVKPKGLVDEESRGTTVLKSAPKNNLVKDILVNLLGEQPTESIPRTAKKYTGTIKDTPTTPAVKEHTTESSDEELKELADDVDFEDEEVRPTTRVPNNVKMKTNLVQVAKDLSTESIKKPGVRAFENYPGHKGGIPTTRAVEEYRTESDDELKELADDVEDNGEVRATTVLINVPKSIQIKSTLVPVRTDNASQNHPGRLEDRRITPRPKDITTEMNAELEELVDSINEIEPVTTQSQSQVSPRKIETTTFQEHSTNKQGDIKIGNVINRIVSQTVEALTLSKKGVSSTPDSIEDIKEEADIAEELDNKTSELEQGYEVFELADAINENSELEKRVNSTEPIVKTIIGDLGESVEEIIEIADVINDQDTFDEKTTATYNKVILGDLSTEDGAQDQQQANDSSLTTSDYFDITTQDIYTNESVINDNDQGTETELFNSSNGTQVDDQDHSNNDHGHKGSKHKKKKNKNRKKNRGKKKRGNKKQKNRNKDNGNTNLPVNNNQDQFNNNFSQDYVNNSNNGFNKYEDQHGNSSDFKPAHVDSFTIGQTDQDHNDSINFEDIMGIYHNNNNSLPSSPGQLTKKDKLFTLLRLRLGEEQWRGINGSIIRDKLEKRLHNRRPGLKLWLNHNHTGISSSSLFHSNRSHNFFERAHNFRNRQNINNQENEHLFYLEPNISSTESSMFRNYIHIQSTNQTRSLFKPARTALSAAVSKFGVNLMNYLNESQHTINDTSTNIDQFSTEFGITDMQTNKEMNNLMPAQSNSPAPSNLNNNLPSFSLNERFQKNRKLFQDNAINMRHKIMDSFNKQANSSGNKTGLDTFDLLESVIGIYSNDPDTRSYLSPSVIGTTYHDKLHDSITSRIGVHQWNGSAIRDKLKNSFHHANGFNLAGYLPGNNSSKLENSLDVNKQGDDNKNLPSRAENTTTNIDEQDDVLLSAFLYQEPDIPPSNSTMRKNGLRKYLQYSNRTRSLFAPAKTALSGRVSKFSSNIRNYLDKRQPLDTNFDSLTANVLTELGTSSEQTTKEPPKLNQGQLIDKSQDDTNFDSLIANVLTELGTSSEQTTKELPKLNQGELVNQSQDDTNFDSLIANQVLPEQTNGTIGELEPSAQQPLSPGSSSNRHSLRNIFVFNRTRPLLSASVGSKLSSLFHIRTTTEHAPLAISAPQQTYPAGMVSAEEMPSNPSPGAVTDQRPSLKGALTYFGSNIHNYLDRKKSPSIDKVEISQTNGTGDFVIMDTTESTNLKDKLSRASKYFKIG